MSKNGRKIILTLVIVYSLAVLIIAAYSFLTVPPIRIGRLKVQWVLGNTLVFFARGLIPVHLSAMLFGFSLFFSPEGNGKKTGARLLFFPKIRFVSITLLILVFLYAVLLEAGLPLGLRLREESAGKIHLADDLRTKAKDAAERGQFREARRYLQYALSIFPDDIEIRQELDSADQAAIFSGRKAPPQPQEDKNDALFLNMTFEDFLEKARNAFDREDYISAEYYGNLALRMNLNHPAPKRIIAESRENLSRSRPNRETRETMEFFRRKQAGVDILTEGDAVAAYRYFQALLEEKPEDPDIRHYLGLAYGELQKASFLLSEIPLTALSAAGGFAAGDIVFINRTDETHREFLHIRRIKKAGSYYAVDIEGIAITENGTILYHFAAPYGKFVDGILIMRCLADNQDEDFKPEYFAGESPDISPFQLPVAADPEKLLLMSAGGADLDRIPLWSLLQTARAAPFLGLSSYPLYMVFFSRIFLPFSFFVLSFFAAAYGLRYKSRYAAAPPLPYFLFLPLLPFILILIFHVYLYGISALQGFLLSFFGFSLSLTIFLLIQGLLLFMALLSFVKQVRE
jgi:tetratricopeptide (TPR) repeat protein